MPLTITLSPTLGERFDNLSGLVTASQSRENLAEPAQVEEYLASLGQKRNYLANLVRRYDEIEIAKLANFLDFAEPQVLADWLMELRKEVGTDQTPYLIEGAAIQLSSDKFEATRDRVFESFENFLLKKAGLWNSSARKQRLDLATRDDLVTSAREKLETDAEVALDHLRRARTLSWDLGQEEIHAACTLALMAVEEAVGQAHVQASDLDAAIKAFQRARGLAQDMGRGDEADRLDALVNQTRQDRQAWAKEKRVALYADKFLDLLQGDPEFPVSRLTGALVLSQGEIEDWFFWLFDYDLGCDNPFKFRHDNVVVNSLVAESESRVLGEALVAWELAKDMWDPSQDYRIGRG